MTDDFSNILTESKRKPINMEADRATEFIHSVYQKYLKLENIHHYSKFTDKGPSIA